jgi:hypothetical protein
MAVISAHRFLFVLQCNLLSVCVHLHAFYTVISEIDDQSCMIATFKFCELALFTAIVQ